MSDWASKLQQKDSAKEGSLTKEKSKSGTPLEKSMEKSQEKNHSSNQSQSQSLSHSQAQNVKQSNKNEASEFNGSEMANFLKNSYASVLEEAKKDKAGEKIRIYQSLESPSGWTKATNGKQKEDRHMSIIGEVARQLSQSSPNPGFTKNRRQWAGAIDEHEMSGVKVAKTVRVS